MNKPRPFRFARHVLRQQPETGESFLCVAERFGLIDWDVVQHVIRLEREQDPLLTPLHYRDHSGWFVSVAPFRSPKRLP